MSVRTAAALSLENLSKWFGNFCAVNQLSLEVQPGMMAGFLGPNGAGKSTTLFMIPRIVRPSAGTIRVFGRDVWQDYKRAITSVGIMVETPAFYEYLSGRRNLEIAARLCGAMSSNQIDEVLVRVRLQERQHDQVRTYSTGMKQRLGIGRAMLGQPRLLILDEPTNGMDPEGTQEILSFLRERVTRNQLTILISSHLMTEVEEFCDTLFLINNGQLAASGNVRDILDRCEPSIRVTFSGAVPTADVLTRYPEVSGIKALTTNTIEITLRSADPGALNYHLQQDGFRISALVPKQKTLKEFFLSITGEQRKHG